MRKFPVIRKASWEKGKFELGVRTERPVMTSVLPALTRDELVDMRDEISNFLVGDE